MKSKYGETFEESIKKAEELQNQHEEATKQMGMAPPDDPDAPYLRRISPDPALNGKLTYYIGKEEVLPPFNTLKTY